MRTYDIKSPKTGNALTEPEEFNLMFQSSIGPTGQQKGYALWSLDLFASWEHLVNNDPLLAE